VLLTTGDIRDDLVKAGIDEASAGLLAQQAKPAVWLQTRSIDDEAEIAIGATKLGGRPDLPAGIAWPVRSAWPDAEERTQSLRELAADPDAWSWAKPERREEIRQDTLERIRRIESEQPLSFVAQINLAEMWEAGPLDADMPRQGILSIFYDMLEEDWGLKPQSCTGFAVLFHDDAGLLTRRDEPNELRNPPLFYCNRLSLAACAPHRCMTPVPFIESEYDRLGLSDELAERVWENWWTKSEHLGSSEKGDAWTCHHIGGWPTPIEGHDMQTRCALLHAGHNGDLKDPALAHVRATAADWLLLAQIGSDENGGMMWGDCGQLYVWIRRDHLKARCFEKAWLILQCY